MSAWADQVESEEATHGALANNSDFPTLGEAAAAKPQGKSKAKKGVKLGFGEFLSMPTGGRGDFADKGLADKQILMSLPTAPRGGPREDGDGRPPGGLGGGFRDYGGDREGRGGRYQREDRPPREEREPSRADSVDDWGSTRKFVPGGDGGGFGGSRGFGGGFGDRGDRPPREPRPPSNADMVDDWGTARKFEPSGPAPRGGFDDRRRYDGPPPMSKADLEDSWGRGRDFKPSESPAPPRGFGGSRDGPRESTADREDRWARRTVEPSTSAAPEAPAERPRLKLAPRSVPVGEQAPAASSSGGAEERKASSNPFGAARPREEVLKEKGVDPIKEVLKLEHGEVIRDETPAEKALKAEVDALAVQLADLKAKLAAEKDADGDEAEAPSGPTIPELEHELDKKECALLKLQAEEDDRVRFARGGRSGHEGVGKERPPRRGDADGAGKDGGAPPARRERW
ncbi:hypothetical protein VOLCADRAFT_121634 [Volvox carteri f. nagariensis]|uniref:Uncharacterized protein n=1 Tax=Volvox carteri f. nagariensis TaxID=3068 RepID=D8UFJ9_VOLCA|nr:uncharacterized protein VOLCADRAFT_121634 [Volvox carteri f. nagariensis]EFJ41517.1 hypothetical protein VOLCADRAFT_121634 [Volvox carteri f. nagariensis]|eukprot:XP_002957462.1 hypothetical protein VOLCADRAFT_121634 [Volvox carteri f. nagariensis]